MGEMMEKKEIDPWYLENLVCPVDHTPLRYSEGKLISSQGRVYPVVEGIPVMLIDGIEQTIPLAKDSLARAKGVKDIIDSRASDLYLETLGISEEEKEGIVNLTKQKNLKVDPVVAYIIGATCGNSYKHLMGKLCKYPIPELPLGEGNGKTFLDIGCGWGRWSISAMRKGYKVAGIDPSLGAIMAGRRVARELGLSPKYIVGDARFLPFKDSIFDVAFSYSVLQHLNKEDVITTLRSIARVLNHNGISLIQMANLSGLHNFILYVKNLFQKKQEFGITYWTIPELKKRFSKIIGNTRIEVDCFLGLGLQKSDIDLMPQSIRFIINISELLKLISKKIKPLVYLADSVYVKAVKLETSHD